HRMGVLVVELDRGEPLPVDLVVVAAGVRPRDELAVAAGLVVDEEDGGVLVDDQLLTSDPHILAIGDCARHAGVAYGLVGPGYEMARVAAERLAGDGSDTAVFTGADRSCRLSVAGIEVAALGEHDGGGRPLVFHDGEVRRTLVLRGGAVIGARSVGPWPRIDEIELAIASGRRLLAQEIDRFCRTGDPFTARAPGRGGVERWPDAALACRCARVTCGAVRAEIAAGCSSLAALGSATGAGTVCGSCRPALTQLWTGKARPRRVSRTFAALSALAVAAVVGFVAAPPLSIDGSGGLLEFLARFWVPGGHKMASGIALAGATGAALTLIATRRLWRSRRGPLFLGLHALIGVTAMLILVAHTGLHAGSNLNGALLIAFLGAIATGGALGLSSLVARRARSPLLWSHLLLLGVLPVLLAFHIVAVFYF
ncbi:MAG TPA: FAD-dependent oxidoreductase, partial [Kofleriaceae bacterium]|nr:FAD-dependent oxidoreductase [Kofleriaceae bacterium]